MMVRVLSPSYRLVSYTMLMQVASPFAVCRIADGFTQMGLRALCFAVINNDDCGTEHEPCLWANRNSSSHQEEFFIP